MHIIFQSCVAPDMLTIFVLKNMHDLSELHGPPAAPNKLPLRQPEYNRVETIRPFIEQGSPCSRMIKVSSITACILFQSAWTDFKASFNQPQYLSISVSKEPFGLRDFCSLLESMAEMSRLEDAFGASGSPW